MSDPVIYTAVLPTSRVTVQHIAALLLRHRLSIGTRAGRWVLGVFAHAVLICRLLLDAVRVSHPPATARDNAMSVCTAYHHVHEALDVLAAHAPRLRPALLAGTLPATRT